MDISSRLRFLRSNTAHRKKTEQKQQETFRLVRADVDCICLKLDFFLLNAEVQVQTCNCIPATRILSQHSLSGQHRAGPPLKPSLSALEVLTVFKGAKNPGRTGAKRSRTKHLSRWHFCTKKWVVRCLVGGLRKRLNQQSVAVWVNNSPRWDWFTAGSLGGSCDVSTADPSWPPRGLHLSEQHINAEKAQSFAAQPKRFLLRIRKEYLETLVWCNKVSYLKGGGGVDRGAVKLWIDVGSYLTVQTQIALFICISPWVNLGGQKEKEESHLLF